MLCLGGRAFSLKQVVHRKGGLIIGEGDTGKSTYAGLLAQALEHGGAKPVFVKLRSRPTLALPDVPEGETQTIIWDGLDEYPECAREIIDLTDGLDPNRYHVWVTSRPGPAASSIARSSLLEDVYHLGAFTNDDVMAIANSVKLDGRKFLEQVRGTHFESFISKPGGAMILMQLFANGQLSDSSRTGLMELIMRDFARETRDGDSEANPKLGYSEEQVVEATCWIAACLVLTGKDAVWTGAESECPANDIPLAKIPVRDYGIDLFKSALGLRLFEPLTGDRYRLAYSEMPPFLAGRWIAKNLSKDQITALIPQDEEFFTEDHARVVAWASCYRPPIGRKWIEFRPDFFFSCHKLIAEFGCKKFFGLLVEYYRDSELCCPQDLLRHRAAELSGFDDFIEVLCDVVALPQSGSTETGVAAVLLQDCAVGREDVAETLVDRLCEDNRLSELDTYRLVRAIGKVCADKRFPCLEDIGKLVKRPGNSCLAATIRDLVRSILGLNPAVASFPRTVRPHDSDEGRLMTEREVDEALRTNDILTMTAVAEKPVEERYYPLIPADEKFLEESYPELSDETKKTMSEDEITEYEEKKHIFREELFYARTRTNYAQLDIGEEEDDIEEGPVREIVQALETRGTIIDQIVHDQDARGLAYFALDRYFHDFYIRQGNNPFICPKLFTYALGQDPEAFVPLLINSIEDAPLFGLVYLAALEKTVFMRYLTDALRSSDVFTAIRLYRIILGGGRLFNGMLLRTVINRIESEPTEEVEDALEDIYDMDEPNTETPVDPAEFNEDGDVSGYNLGIANLLQMNERVEEINSRVIRRVSLARRLLDGKVMVTMEDLAGLGVEEKVQPASQNDVRRIVQAAANSITQTVEALPAKTVEALKSRGGRPKKSDRAAGAFTQAQIAGMFGAPCTVEKVANWEAKARGAKRGSNPPTATIDGVIHSYSQKLRENPTAENMAILAAIVRDYKSRVAVKQRLKDAPTIVHAKNEETSARMRGVVQEESRKLHENP